MNYVFEMSKKQGLVLLPLVALAVGCGGEPPAPRGDSLRVVATTGMVGDLVRAVGGAQVQVTTLMGPGVDPHLFKASEGDVRRLAEAEAVFVNGLHLEGKMGEILAKMRVSRPVVAVAEAAPAAERRSPPEFRGQVDPHLWFDVRLWRATIDPVVAELSRLRPAAAAEFTANGERYRAELAALDAWVEERLATVPPGQRVLVTAHDAFGYFGRRYGWRIVPLQGISTLAEAGLQDVDRVVETVVAAKVPAIFVESSVPRRAIEAVVAGCRARGASVAIGGELYSDALGAADGPAGSYVGMVRANVETIVRALAGEAR